MQFRASSPYDLYRPSKCALRVALRHRRVPEAARSPFDELLAKLGTRHEKAHLASLPGAVDLSGLDQETRERETLAAIRAGAPAIYQARFRTALELDGEACELVGEPDFLIRREGGYVIRDSKLSRRINGRDHPEIPYQLQLYGLLYERCVGTLPVGLEIHAGSGQIVPIPYDGQDAALRLLRDLCRMRLAPEDAYEPVGWSKCNGCGYRSLCWPRAVAANDIALLPALTQANALRLREHRIAAIRDIPAAIHDPVLRELFYEGKKNPRLRDSARRLLLSAEAHASGKHKVIAAPNLPDAPNFAVLDLEGLPPFQDELEKIYLWGVKVFGERPSSHLFAQAGFGPEGDREGWLAFLRLVSRLLAEYGEIPFVHWSAYERTKLQLYIDRYGDPDATAARLLDHLLDLLAVVRESVAFPLPSLSLKVIEKYVGFERKLADTDGAWAMARYIEATETSDPAARDAIMGQILEYNREDLEATWSVMEWIRLRTSPGGGLVSREASAGAATADRAHSAAAIEPRLPKCDNTY